jgi:hypothetical protein
LHRKKWNQIVKKKRQHEQELEHSEQEDMQQELARCTTLMPGITKIGTSVP